MPKQDLAARLAEEEAKLQKRFKRRLIIAGIVILVLAVGTWLMIGFSLRYTAFPAGIAGRQGTFGRTGRGALAGARVRDRRGALADQ